MFMLAFLISNSIFVVAFIAFLFFLNQSKRVKPDDYKSRRQWAILTRLSLVIWILALVSMISAMIRIP